jgi:signal transduction histidine kinase
MASVPSASERDGTRASAAPQHGQTRHLRILHLEDDTADSELIGSLLRTAGLDCELERVDTRAAFEASLASGAFQIILSDYSLPGFDGQAALGLARSLKPEVPFLFVSGTIGEDLAIESLKEGATDFVLKDRLQRLAPAVRRALAEAEERAFRQRSEAERERLLADLEVKNAELELFTYAVSHDLKSPLITIRGFADQARTAVGQGDRERALADLERIANASALMQRLLHELLDLSRIGRVVNPPQTLSLRELAEQAMALARGRLDGMAVELAPELPEVRGDPARLLQVLQTCSRTRGSSAASRSRRASRSGCGRTEPRAFSTCATTASASSRATTSASSASSTSSTRAAPARGSASRSRAASSRPTAAGCGSSQTANGKARPSASHCPARERAPSIQGSRQRRLLARPADIRGRG